MPDTGQPRVLVGVSRAEADAALEYAAGEAERRGCGLHVVHVLHPVFAGSPDLAELRLVGGELRAAGSDILERAVARTQELLQHTELPVTSQLLHGAVAPTLVDSSERSCLVVLQRRKSRLRVLSVLNGVAAHAHAPVVAVPDYWRAGAHTAPVVIGVEDATASTAVTRAGLDVARRNRVPAELLHGWWVTDLASAGTFREEQSRAEGGRLERELRPVLADYEDVEWRIRSEHEGPAELLVAASRTAGLVVVGRHHTSLPFGSHLGPIVRAVLREAHCPVMVVDPRPAGS